MAPSTYASCSFDPASAATSATKKWPAKFHICKPAAGNPSVAEAFFPRPPFSGSGNMQAHPDWGASLRAWLFDWVLSVLRQEVSEYKFLLWRKISCLGDIIWQITACMFEYFRQHQAKKTFNQKLHV